MTGVYQIRNIINNKIYIGSASHIGKFKSNSGFKIRFKKHILDLNNNKHYNNHLQNAWNKYGQENFEFEILTTCPSEYCLKLEQWFLDSKNPDYNVNPTAGSCLGRKLSQEHKDKIGKANKGKIITEEQKKIISFKNKKENNPEKGIKISIANTGKKRSEKARISNRDKRRLHKSITKLSINDVKTIKKRLLTEKATIISKDYDCSYSSIMDIKHKRTFSDITNE